MSLYASRIISPKKCHFWGIWTYEIISSRIIPMRPFIEIHSVTIGPVYFQILDIEYLIRNRNCCLANCQRRVAMAIGHCRWPLTVPPLLWSELLQSQRWQCPGCTKLSVVQYFIVTLQRVLTQSRWPVWLARSLSVRADLSRRVIGTGTI